MIGTLAASFRPERSSFRKVLRIPRRGWPRAFTSFGRRGGIRPCRMGRRTRTPSSGTAGASLSSAIPASRAPGSACGCTASGAERGRPVAAAADASRACSRSPAWPTWCRRRYGDIRDLDAVRGALRELQPEIVFHLAAQPLVRPSYREPVETYATNVMGTVHVLEAVRSAPSVRGVIVVTSDKCYENREWPWAYRETEAMGGHDPVQQLQGLRRTGDGGLPALVLLGRPIGVATARAGNVIGGGDWAEDRLLPDCMRALGAGEADRDPQSARRAAVAARAGAAVRLPAAGRTTGRRCRAASATRGTSVRPMTTRDRSPGSRRASWSSGATARLVPRRRRRAARGRRAEGRCLAGAHAARLGAAAAARQTRWPGRSSGTGALPPASRRWR